MAGQEKAEDAHIIYRQLELILPPKDLVLPPNSYTPSEKLLRIQHNFISSPHIIVDATSMRGLGDSIIGLRPAVFLAINYPNKKFTVKVLQEVKDIAYLNLPKNLELTSGGLNEFAQEDGSFFTVFAPGGGPSSLNGWMQIKLQEQERVFDDSIWPTPKPRDSRKLDDLPVALNDVRLLLRLFMLGVNVTSEAELDPVILNLGSAQELYTKPVHNLLIAPDAKEYEEQVGKFSKKSLPVEYWREIFEILQSIESEYLQIGIVRGHAHPEYTDAVFNIARQRYPNAQQIITPSLQDFCRAVLQCKTFVGPDSGTTHLAAEVAKAVR